jgi:hypothetical protein
MTAGVDNRYVCTVCGVVQPDYQDETMIDKQCVECTSPNLVPKFVVVVTL